MRQVYTNGFIFSQQGFFYGGFAVENGRFSEVFAGERTGIDLQGVYVLPGLVDIHIHGAMGADFSDGDGDGLVRMGRYLAQEGVTSFVPTSMTLPYETLAKACAVARQKKENWPVGCANLAGVRLEGPFLSERKKGAQNPAYLRKPDYNAFESLWETSGGLVRIMDVAGELPGAVDFARQASQKAVVSLGHTDCTYEQACAFYKAGARHLTHLFNALPGIHHRNPGPIAAASEREEVTAEVIGDGRHVHPSVLRLAYKLFPGRLCLISDGLRCMGMPEGEYTLGEQKIFLRDGLATLADGTIAGSAASLYTCLQRVLSFGVDPIQAIFSATTLPARVLGMENEIGSIRPGARADFLLCDSHLHKRQVYLGGEALLPPLAEQ